MQCPKCDSDFVYQYAGSKKRDVCVCQKCGHNFHADDGSDLDVDEPKAAIAEDDDI